VYTKRIDGGGRSLLAVVAVACGMFAGSVLAKDPDVTVALRVSAQGLDLSQPADAQTFYKRLKAAAVVVCTHGDRVDLVPSDDPKGCYEKALADAIRSAKAPLLTQIYLASHTVQGASTGWSYVPMPAATK
jgi:UrcA family protein